MTGLLTYRKLIDDIGIGYVSELDFNIIKKQTKILADIFDKKNSEVCSNCNRNYDVGKEKIRVRDTGCCGGCENVKGHFGYPQDDDPFSVHIKLKKIMEYYNFNSKSGFFDLEQKTCNLPRELRSNVCLSYKCKELRLTIKEQNTIIECVRILRCIRKDLKLPF